ncbi:DedA family protein [Candidatus Microgenomates bacterium]|nr:DedA family protein [Candidatus Microgenomates bacterium]
MIDPVLKIWELINRFELTSLFILILLEEAGVPLPAPGDIFIMNAGWRSHGGGGNFLRVLGVVLVATIVGSSVLYWIARRLGRKLVLKHLKFLHISQERLKKVEGWFQRRGGIVIVVGRLTPGLRIVISLVAGFFAISYHVFIFYTVIATVIWVSIYFYLGSFLGKNFVIMFKFLFREHPFLTYPFIILLLILLVRYFYTKAFNRAINEGG